MNTLTVHPAPELWSLTCSITPRRAMRVDSWDAATQRYRHRYLERAWPTTPPDAPYAIYLTDNRKRFRLLVFDLDATRGDITPDLHRLRDLLDTAGARYIVTASGPTGGRHIWLSLGEHGEASKTIRDLAILLAKQLPTLDYGLLCNPHTGAARPPGSPHREGDHARLLFPATPARAARELADPNTGVVDKLTQALLATTSTPEERQTRIAPHHTIVTRGHAPALAGLQRPLSTRTQQALDTPVGHGDASAILASIFVGMALARWTLADVIPLVDSAPGLEHLRTRRSGPGQRQSRAPGETRQLLRRQWARSVRYAAALPPAAIDDASDRATATAHTIGLIQEHVNSTPQRWSPQAGPADRGVLDALCLTALRACSTTIDLDVRRAALLAGVSKSAAARAFHRLQAAGHIRCVAPAAGPRAARWQLLLRGTEPSTDGTQGTRPPESPRGNLLETLTRTVQIRTADLFAPRKIGGLGRASGYIASQLVKLIECTKLERIVCYTASRVRVLVDELCAEGVVAQHRDRLTLTTSRLISSSRLRGVLGYRATQARMYAIDREVFAWWREEEQWMRAPKRSQRPLEGQEMLLGRGSSRRRAFPRVDGRANFASARAEMTFLYAARKVQPWAQRLHNILTNRAEQELQPCARAAV